LKIGLPHPDFVEFSQSRMSVRMWDWNITPRVFNQQFSLSI
jgi:hypothetical protein